MSKYVIDSATLTSIGDAVRQKEGTTGAILVKDLASRISAIETGGGDFPQELLEIQGVCDYKFSYTSWNWLLNKYGSKMKTDNILSAQYMFSNNNTITKIPFDMNMTTKEINPNVTAMFQSCEKLEEIPKIIGRVRNTKSVFKNCYSLNELKEESIKDIDWSLVDKLTGAYDGGERDGTFEGCYSLRKFPMSFLEHGNQGASYSTAVYRNVFSNCYAIDEVVGLPFPHMKANWTSNAFNATFSYCGRLKRFTFKTNEDGSPVKVTGWKNQVITLSQNVGYLSYSFYITNYSKTNGGITSAHQVKDDATYQALKDDPNYWTDKVEYSRYNHDSAVETINSLPDVTSGSGNTIKFTGNAGSKTDGGAINTLTAEEIAVATAKGWTVTLA